MGKILQTGINIRNIAETPVHQVNKMRKLGEKRTAIEFFSTMPTVFYIIPLIAIPVTIDLNDMDFA